MRRLPLSKAALLLPSLLIALAACEADADAPSLAADHPTPIPGLAAAPAALPINGSQVARTSGGAFTSSDLPSIADVVEAVRPAVVTITVQAVDSNSFLRPVTSVQSGTGAIITEDGYVVTNYHVIRDAQRIIVTTDWGDRIDAEVVGDDQATDLAVLKLNADQTFPRLTFADPDSIRVGDWVIAVGNALGLRGGPSVTLGVVGALDRSLQTRRLFLTDLIQTDAAINEGNSGGPLINLHGEIVGINTAVLRAAQGIGFSISSFTVVPVVESILRSGRVVWPWLGISAEDVTPALAVEEDLETQEGVVIRRVWTDSPASAVDLHAGDIILELDGNPVPTLRSLQRLMREVFRVEQEISVKYRRGGKTMDLRLSLEAMPR